MSIMKDSVSRDPGKTGPSPKGSSHVEQKIVQKLQECPYDEIRRASLRFDEGVAVLQGNVSSFYMKQLAQTMVREFHDVRQIVNWLTVVYPEERQA